MSGPELKQRLRLAGIPQADLARRTGFSQAMVCRVLKGERTLPTSVAEEAERQIKQRVADAARALVGEREMSLDTHGGLGVE